MRHHAWLIFVVSLETGFPHVGQAGLKLLTSSALPTSASQNVRITELLGVKRHKGRATESEITLEEKLKLSVTVLESLREEQVEVRSRDKGVVLGPSSGSSSWPPTTVEMVVSRRLTLYTLPWVWRYRVDFISSPS
ncbi:hypothetical protein AAY473_008243 [Plecturocebus cupreus]